MRQFKLFLSVHARMKHKLAAVMLLAILFFQNQSGAEIMMGLQTNLSTFNTTTISTAPEASESMIDGYFHVQLVRDSSVYLTLGYLYGSSIKLASATTTSLLTLSVPYGGLTYYFGQRNFFSLGVYASPYIQANYSVAGSDPEIWNGSSFYTKFSLLPILSESFSLQISLAYFSANFNTKVVTTSVSNVSTFNQSIVAPMIGVQYLF